MAKKTMYEYLIFDLDGTISDPKEGIVKSLNYALATNGYETKESKEIEKYIGPPLDYAFGELTSVMDEEEIAKLVKSYRERYAEVGYSENVLYKGMSLVLTSLAKNCSVKMGVCTSKRKDFAEKILELFQIRHLFEFVNGGDVGIQKWQQIEKLLGNGFISKSSVMIGDRSVDLVAAHKNGISSAGVLWGYGSRRELSTEKPRHIFSTPQQLAELIAYNK